MKSDVLLIGEDIERNADRTVRGRRNPASGQVSSRPAAVISRWLSAVMLSLALGQPSVLHAGGSAADLGSNGQHRRPFYIVGHNPNELPFVEVMLAAGANALEPDVMRFTDDTVVIGTSTKVNDGAGASGLFMYHDDVEITTRMPTTVEAYFDYVHNRVKLGSNIALITLDIKTPAATADLIENLRTAVLGHLNYDGVLVNIIYSVATLDDAKTGAGAFSSIVSVLNENEGVMIDGENDPVAVYDYLHGIGAKRIGFGNGSIGISLGLAPSVLPSIDQASWLRAGQHFDLNRFRYGGPGEGFAIPYAFPIPSITSAALTQELITAGADGLIPDQDSPIVDLSITALNILDLRAKIDGDSDHYVATAADNPFYVPVEAYGLKIKTRDQLGAGTDSDLTFTLAGSCGSASVTVDASYQNRFERDDTNYVTIHSKNLGLLSSLTLSSDGTGIGPGWDPGEIEISSVRWGIPESAHRTVTFDTTVDEDEPATKPLASLGYECDNTAPTASPVQSPPANGAGWNNTDVSVNWNWIDNPGGTGIAIGRCTTNSNTTAEGTQTLDAQCSDVEGNVGMASLVVRVDKTAPGVQCGAADGIWHAADVSIACTAADGGSGLADAADASFQVATALPAGTESNNALTGVHAVLDVAGNSTTAGPIGRNMIDKKAPEVQCGTADGVWHAADVSIACTASDGGSGLANAADASFLLSTALPAGTESNNAATGVHSVLDVLGHSATAGPIGGNMIDKKPPVIGINQPAAAEYTHSAKLTLDYSVTDGGSSAATVTPLMDGSPTVAGNGLSSGQEIDLLTALPLGMHTFEVSSVDAVGNGSLSTVTFTIIATAESMTEDLAHFQVGGDVTTKGNSLLTQLTDAGIAHAAGQCADAASMYRAFINHVQAQTGKTITPVAAAILIADAEYLIAHCP